MIRQIGFELFKMAKRPRSYTGFVAFLVINIIMVLAGKYGNLGSAGATGGGVLQVTGSPVNAELLAWAPAGSPFAGPMLVMWLPFFVSLVVGEIFPGESAEGTIRALLTRPVTRESVFGAKAIAGAIYAGALVAFLGISGYALGAAFFGTGGLLTFSPDSAKLVWYSHGEALARLALAYGLTFVVMLTIGTVALFLSIWINNSLGAIGGTLMLLFASLIVIAFDFSKHFRPYLFGTHVAVGQKAFLDPIPWHEIGVSVLCLGVYIVVLAIGSLMIFKRRDVLA